MNKQRERLYYLFQESKCPMHFLDNKQMLDTTDYLLANDVIVPPCKVGQTVWANKGCFHLPYTEHGKVIPCEVIAIKETKKGKYILLKPLLIETYGMRKVNAWFPFSAVGKTAFLSREEAENALNNFQNGNSCEGGVQG